MTECVICGGKGSIMLPVIQPPLTIMDSGPLGIPAAPESTRSYPCPECTPKPLTPNSTPFDHDRWSMLDARTKVDARMVKDNPAYKESRIRSLVSYIAAKIVEEGLCDVEEYKMPPSGMSFDDVTICVRVGAVWPKGRQFQQRFAMTDSGSWNGERNADYEPMGGVSGPPPLKTDEDRWRDAVMRERAKTRQKIKPAPEPVEKPAGNRELIFDDEQ